MREQSENAQLEEVFRAQKLKAHHEDEGRVMSERERFLIEIGNIEVIQKLKINVEL